MNLVDDNDRKVDKIPLVELSRALARCEDADMIRDFLFSIFTAQEVKDISLRWLLVRLIDMGQTQRGIADELGLSLCKITRGAKELKKSDFAFARMIRIFQESCEDMSHCPD